MFFVVVVGTLAAFVVIAAGSASVAPLATLLLVIVGVWWSIRSQRARVAAEHLATARRQALALLPPLGRPTLLDQQGLVARFWGPDAAEPLPESRRPGATFSWALVVERHYEYDDRDGRVNRQAGGNIAFLKSDGRVHVVDAGSLAYRNENDSFVAVVSTDGAVTFHDRDPERTAEETHPATTRLLAHPLLSARKRDPTWTGWELRSGAGFGATVLPVPGSGWTIRWEGGGAPRDHFRLDHHPTLLAALTSVIAVAEGRVRPVLHAPPEERTLATADASVELARSAVSATASPGQAQPLPAPTRALPPARSWTNARPPRAPPRPVDLLHLDMGRIDDRTTVGFFHVLSGRRSGDVIRIFGQRMIIGRASDCDISFPFDQGVSSKHAMIQVEDLRCLIVETGESGGLLVNQERCHSKALEEGDMIQLGSSCLLKFTREVVALSRDGSPRALN
jgi:hypothetical protein